MDAQIRIIAGDPLDELASLWDWLHDEDGLRGNVSPVEQPIGDTELGSGFELLTVVLGSSGTALALARALSTWLGTRRSDVKVTVSVGDRQIEVEATNLKDVLPTLEHVLQIGDGTRPD